VVRDLTVRRRRRLPGRARTAFAVAVVLAADGLLGVDEAGHTVSRLPYALSLALSVVVTVLAAAAFHRTISDVAIKRTTG
jgi:hypothetical protein